MKRLESLQSSLRYIEDNLRGEVSHDIAAKKALLSKFYYYRMFHMVTGITLSEYIRNRKMSLAAKQLKESDMRILDIALDFGYGSQEAFTRAFKSVHGITPAQARKPEANVKAYPPITFQLVLKGDVEMEYKIEKKESINILGVSKKVTSKDGENFKIIPKFWEETMKNGTFNKIVALTDSKEYNGSFGICANYIEETNEFDYIIGTASRKEAGEFNSFSVPEATYAVFGPVVLSKLQDFWKRIFSEWLPATDYEITNGPQVEYYLPEPMAENEVSCEVWIPIKE